MPAPIVVIVTHRGGPLLARCVEALARQSSRPERVIVVVSASEPVPPPLPCGLALEMLYQGCNVGFARAANAGLRAAAGHPVVLLNDDTEPEPGFLAGLAAAAEAGPGLYQPCIVLADGSGRLDNLGHHLFPDGFNLAVGRGRPETPSVAELGTFSGAAVYLSAEVLGEVGLFDEDLGAFGEDADLSLRAVRRGYRIRAVPQARIHHQLGATYGRTAPRKVYLVERNRVRLALRSLPATALLAMPAWTTLRLAALALAALRGRGPGAGCGPRGAVAALAGGLAGLAAAPDALRKRRQDAAGWTQGEGALWRHLWQHRVRLADLEGAL